MAKDASSHAVWRLDSSAPAPNSGGEGSDSIGVPQSMWMAVTEKQEPLNSIFMWAMRSPLQTALP
jgi:hypothetical protein